jgi:hypothetical protein
MNGSVRTSIHSPHPRPGLAAIPFETISMDPRLPLLDRFHNPSPSSAVLQLRRARLRAGPDQCRGLCQHIQRCSAVFEDR